MTGMATASALGIGLRMAADGRSVDADRIQALRFAVQHGCSWVDLTAPPGPEVAVAQEVLERSVGQLLSARWDGVSVLCGTADLRPVAVVDRVRQVAARLRRDRADLLLLQRPERLLTGADPRAGERALLAAMETCERLVDQGVLRAYGVASAQLVPDTGLPGLVPTGAVPELTVGRLAALAAQVRRGHHLAVVRAPGSQLTRHTEGRGSLALACRRWGLRTVGAQVLPRGPRQGLAPLGTCQQVLLDGVDHVVADVTSVAQASALLPLMCPTAGVGGSAALASVGVG